MAAATEKIATIGTKNRLFVTIPEYGQSHRCYANFYKNRFGKEVLRPVLPKEEHKKADLIHTTLWNEGSQLAVCNSCYIDCDVKLCREDLKLKGRINEAKLRAELNQKLGAEASGFLKLVRSRSGKGIHVWFFFPGFPIMENSKEVMTLLGKIQIALIKLLEPFGADPYAAGIERWGTNWRNPERSIDTDTSVLQARVSREKKPVLGILYRALKADPQTASVFLGPLKRWYPDQRVSRKVTAFVARNLKALDAGEELILSRKDLLTTLGISKSTLPELLTEPVGPSRTRLRGLLIERDLLRWGHYRINCAGDYLRLRHLAERYGEDLASSNSASEASKRTGQAIMMFEPTRRPEAVSDGERNYAITQVYLKLKWHGCSWESAKKIADAYVKRIPGNTASSSIHRHEAKGDNVYNRFKENNGCRPGIAEDWLLSLVANRVPSMASESCTKTPKGELLCDALAEERKNFSPSSSSSAGRASVGTTELGRKGLSRGEGSSSKPGRNVVSLESWRKKASASSVVKNLASVLTMKQDDRAGRSADILSRKLEGKAKAERKEESMTSKLSRLLREDRRFDGQRKTALLERFTALYTARQIEEFRALAASLGWLL